MKTFASQSAHQNDLRLFGPPELSRDECENCGGNCYNDGDCWNRCENCDHEQMAFFEEEEEATPEEMARFREKCPYAFVGQGVMI